MGPVGRILGRSTSAKSELLTEETEMHKGDGPGTQQ